MAFFQLQNEQDTENFFRQVFAMDIPEEELETVQLRYIPEYIRELKNKQNYWKEEFEYWGDIISERNWKMYEKQVNDELNKHKKILKHINDKLHFLFVRFTKDDNHFTQSLDAERVHALVTYIKENKSNVELIPSKTSPDDVTLAQNITETLYVIYATCAVFGEYRVLRSHPTDEQSKEED